MATTPQERALAAAELRALSNPQLQDVFAVNPQRTDQLVNQLNGGHDAGNTQHE